MASEEGPKFYGAWRCPGCSKKIHYVGRDECFGGSLVECKSCDLKWSAGNSMTGPETVFFPVDENWEPSEWRAQPYSRFDIATELFILGVPILLLGWWILTVVFGK